jgi:hypothetical protein
MVTVVHDAAERALHLQYMCTCMHVCMFLFRYACMYHTMHDTYDDVSGMLASDALLVVTAYACMPLCECVCMIVCIHVRFMHA